MLERRVVEGWNVTSQRPSFDYGFRQLLCFCGKKKTNPEGHIRGTIVWKPLRLRFYFLVCILTHKQQRQWEQNQKSIQNKGLQTKDLEKTFRHGKYEQHTLKDTRGKNVGKEVCL